MARFFKQISHVFHFGKQLPSGLQMKKPALPSLNHSLNSWSGFSNQVYLQNSFSRQRLRMSSKTVKTESQKSWNKSISRLLGSWWVFSPAMEHFRGSTFKKSESPFNDQQVCSEFQATKKNHKGKSLWKKLCLNHSLSMTIILI